MVARLEEVGLHDHLCLIYENTEEQVAAFVPFIQSGLVQNDLCVYLLDESERDWIVEKLGANDFPLEEYLHRGALRFIETKDAYLKGGYFATEKTIEFWNELVKEALASGYRCVRAAAEMSWSLQSFPGCDQLVPYESKINSVLPTVNVIGLCQYNRRRFDPSVVQKMIHVHPLVCVSKQLIHNPGFVSPDAYSESDANIQTQALIDNLLMTKKLVDANQRLQQALEEKEQAQALIEERNREREQLYEELQSLAKAVSHELQAPLHIIQSYLRLISARYKSRLGRDADEFIDKSVNAARLVGRMIDDLWDYARVDLHGEGVTENVNAAKVLREVHADPAIQALIEKTDATIEAVSEMPNINISRQHLRYLFRALISNGIKYRRPDCRPEIQLAVHDDADAWLFSVKDNGRGLDNVHSADVFRLFYRIDQKASEDGTGMGLPICKRITDQYKGKIWFDSQPGKGTTFWFSIPKTSHIAQKVTDIRQYAAQKMEKNIQRCGNNGQVER